MGFNSRYKEHMNESAISDNWSLQEISELLVSGLEKSDTAYIVIDREKDSYSYKKVPRAVIQTQALFDFITDLILRDEILVEKKFTYAWDEAKSPVDKALKAGVIKPYPFLVDYKKLIEPRNEFVKRLCITTALKTDHEVNKKEWIEKQETPHQYLSQILWGGSGMLARGFVYGKTYTPHPLRQKFFRDAGIAMQNQDAVIAVKSLIQEKRAVVMSKSRFEDELYSLTLNIPPLPSMAIRESNTIEDLITVSLQLRQEYQELRRWLGNYQKALTDGSYKDIQKFQKIIRSISQYIDSKMGKYDSNSPTFSAGIGCLKIAFQGQPLNELQNQYGVRSMVNKIVFCRSRDSDLKKFLSFFDEADTVTGLKVIEHFSE